MLNKNCVHLFDKNKLVRNQIDKTDVCDNIVQINETDIDNILFNNLPLNTLYYLGGYIIHKIKDEKKNM